MKPLRILFFVFLALISTQINAITWYWDGILYGNVCRSGAYYTVYPVESGQPVGTQCPLRDSYGNIVMWGYVSNE